MWLMPPDVDAYVRNGWLSDITNCYRKGMPRYEPLDIAAKVDCLQIELLSFDWAEATARFRLPERDILRVRFGGDVIVRMLDEFALSTEDGPSERSGMIGHHFAYRVSGDPFVALQSKAWLENDALQPCRHYRFITGEGCLDVLSDHEPEIGIEPAHHVKD